MMKKPILLLAGLILSGCAEGYNVMTPAVTPIATEPDLVSTRIAMAAEKASQALGTIAGIEQYRSPAPPVEDYSSAPANLSQPVTIKWTGPIDQIVRMLASRAGMEFRVKGKHPPVPISITVDVYQQPLIGVLRDVGLQAGSRADLAVDSRGSIVEISYAPVDKI